MRVVDSINQDFAQNQSSYKVISNSLAITHPELVQEWHPTKNRSLTVDSVSPGSKLKVWWKCSKGPEHEWDATIYHRSRGIGCPFCSNRKLSSTNSLAYLFPAIAAEWHPTKNADLLPSKIVAGSGCKVWWQCPQGPDHEWQAKVVDRTRAGTGCPCCSGNQVSVTNSLAKKHPQLVAEWHPTKNIDLTPECITSGSSKKVWWKCSQGPDHEWQSSVGDRTNGRSCPFCCGRQVSESNSLAVKFPK